MEKDFHVNDVIKKHFESVLNRIGNFTWAYVVLSKGNLSIAAHATNYPEEWEQYYQVNNLQFTDPIVITALNRLTPFAWDEKITIGNEPFFSSIFNKAKNYNVIKGYTFVIHDHKNNMATLSLLIDPSNNDEMEQCINMHKGEIDLSLASIHEEYLALSLFKNNNDKKNKDGSIFTERENEILYWTSLGKTYNETGTILGIKTTTVKFHMANIIKKLGVTNAKHAVRLGIELDLVKPVN